MDTTRYAQRRSEFMEHLGDMIAIVPAGREQTRNDDVDHDFRQNSDFFFLTGFTEPDAIAVFDPSHDTEQYTLFVRPRDPESESWFGRRVGSEGVRERFGADAGYTIDDFDEWLRRRLRGRADAAYSLGNALDSRVLAALNAARAHAHRVGVTVPDRLIDLTAILHEMRLIKSDGEIAAIREASRISAIAHTEAMRYAAPGRTERQVQAALEYVFAAMGSERVGYGSIVAGGENAVILHYIENDMILNDGDLLLIDAAAEYRHLTADITRTFPVNGEFSTPQRTIYDIVLEAERRVIQMCAPGVPYTDMHTLAVEVLSEGLVDIGLVPGPVDEVIEKGWYRNFFFHGTGHWLGIDVHDAGAYRIDGEGRPLEAGMVFTVEPGIYVAPEKSTITLSDAPYDADEALRLTYELGSARANIELAKRRDEAGSTTFDVPWEFLGIGIRIEDDILVTSNGVENMSSEAPVDPDAIEAVCAEDSALPIF
ncbi:MAG: aminopeptidase P N-terminal domain-containing protein [Actinomycetia bacterium]|nr:aminopeptidase P N-terminal domain-containing protein [Actinomycetes bacterium]